MISNGGATGSNSSARGGSCAGSGDIAEHALVFRATEACQTAGSAADLGTLRNLRQKPSRRCNPTRR